MSNSAIENQITELLNLPIKDIFIDSRMVQAGSVFIALKGLKENGNVYIEDAINKGAIAIVSEQDRNQFSIPEEVYFYKVNSCHQFLNLLAKKFFHQPSQFIKTIGITGTNGKTTITYLTEAIFNEAGFDCGVIGTVSYRIGSKILPAPNTTPSFLQNQKLLAQMVSEHIDYCVMEVSSHALDQRRVDEINFKTAVFTNLTRDHLDYHKTFQNYFLSKSKLFTNLSEDALAVINIDDSYGRKLKSKINASILTYGIENNADVMAKNIECGVQGTTFKCVYNSQEIIFRSRLIGNYNVYNILAATAIALAEDISIDVIRDAIKKASLIPGRLEPVDYQQKFSIFIDYAHTADALENVLNAIRMCSDKRIILVFGCGGDRDKTKRPEMGKVASELADEIIITSDNPRSEQPEDIIKDILKGVTTDRYKVIIDREQAIKKSLQMAGENDIVLIAGKGHEKYQIFKDRTIKFDERQIIRQFIRC